MPSLRELAKNDGLRLGATFNNKFKFIADIHLIGDRAILTKYINENKDLVYQKLNSVGIDKRALGLAKKFNASHMIVVVSGSRECYGAELDEFKMEVDEGYGVQIHAPFSLFERIELDKNKSRSNLILDLDTNKLYDAKGRI